MRIRAPGKVNLFLRVVGARKDGYHFIDSFMVPISLYDLVEITRSKGSRGRLEVQCDHPDVPSGSGNLAYRAADLLLTRKRVEEPVRIRIHKGIPVGAGLGGGSSDAAATLLGLNRLFRLGCGKRELLSLASEVGSDVPFFIYGRPARVRGIGERLSVRRSLRRLWMVILYPGFAVSTGWVYENLKLTKVAQNTSINGFSRDPRKLPKFLINDLEQVTIGRYPQIGLLKDKLLQQRAVGALMAGSGSSVFGIFSSKEIASEAFRRLRKERGVQAYLAHSLTK